GRGGISHRLYGSVADFTPVEECAAAERKDSETPAAKQHPLILSGRLSGHHLSWSRTFVICKCFSVRECRFQTLALGLQCLELRSQCVSLDRQLLSPRLTQFLGPG